MSAAALPILMYHHVCPNAGLVTISPENFRAQMQALAENGWQTLGLEALEAFLAGEDLPKKSLVLSFDDGYFDNWLYAAPILQAFDFKAVLFLASAWIGAGDVRKTGETPNHRACMQQIQNGDLSCMMNWAEVRAARDLGVFEFHSHTHTHTRFDKKYSQVDEKILALYDDLHMTRATFTQELGEISPHLCWPQGYFDADYIKTAQTAGFQYLYTTELGTATRATAALRLPRIVVKDRPANWLMRRLFLYSRPRLAGFYARLKRL